MDKRCPVCASDSFEPARFRLWRCASCGLTVDARIWEDGAEAELTRTWFDDGAYQVDASVLTARFERWNAERTFQRLREAGVTSGRVLEIGVGSGATLAYLRQKGFQVMGCDMSRAVAERTAATHGIPVHCGTLSSLPRQEVMDAIVMNHVLEHVGDPVALLRDAKRLLKANGVIHIAVPNVGAWEARLPGWTSYQPYHLAYFDQDTLSDVARRAGFVPLAVATHEPFSGWFLTLLRTLFGRGAVASAKSSVSGRPAFSAAYRLALLAVGLITWPVRRIQAASMAGEELVLLGRSSP